jgi:hypothetical protein
MNDKTKHWDNIFINCSDKNLGWHEDDLSYRCQDISHEINSIKDDEIILMLCLLSFQNMEQLNMLD